MILDPLDIRTPEDRLRAITAVQAAPLGVQVMFSDPRTKSQNALQWAFAGQVAKHRGDCTADDVQAEWKLKIGVPILRAEDPKFCDLYDQKIRPLPYETKIAVMKLGFPVSRILSKKQMINYMEQIMHSASIEGVYLEVPRDQDA